MTHRRRTFLTAMGSGVTIGLAGCLSDDTEETTSTPDQGGEDDTSGGDDPEEGDGDSRDDGDGSDVVDTEIALSHYPAIVGSSVPTAVALDQGYFEDEGVAIEGIQSFGGGGTTVRGITTGGIGVGGASLPATIQAFNAGAALQLIGVYISAPEFDFQVRPDSEYESIQDLRGETIAVSNPGASSEAALIQSVENAEGISLDDIEILHAGGLGESISALQEELAAASWNAPPLSTQMLADDEVRRLWHTQDFTTDLTELVLVAGIPTMEDDPELAERFIRGHIRGADHAKDDPEAAGRMFAEAADVPEEIGIEAVQDVQPEEIWNVELDEDLLKTTADTMIAQDLIEEQPSWEDLIDQSALPEEQQVDWI